MAAGGQEPPEEGTAAVLLFSLLLLLLYSPVWVPLAAGLLALLPAGMFFLTTTCCSGCISVAPVVSASVLPARLHSVLHSLRCILSHCYSATALLHHVLVHAVLSLAVSLSESPSVARHRLALAPQRDSLPESLLLWPCSVSRPLLSCHSICLLSCILLAACCVCCHRRGVLQDPCLMSACLLKEGRAPLPFHSDTSHGTD